MKTVANQTFSSERALYNSKNLLVTDCRFEGVEDGESFLKESEDVVVKDCFMDLRYPLWHNSRLKIVGGEMTERCRAALWYDKSVTIERCKMNGIKAVRECEDVALKDCRVNSPEFGWRSKGIRVEQCDITSEYAFFESSDITMTSSVFSGKYSFQYTRDVNVTSSVFKTKDAFWHSHNATVKDCVLDGEYIGWYSDGLTLVNCRISGTQSFCYCQNLTLVNCTMEGCDLAFEYSTVNADVVGNILSVKNPLSGKIVADSIGEIITSDSKYPSIAEIIIRK